MFGELCYFQQIEIKNILLFERNAMSIKMKHCKICFTSSILKLFCDRKDICHNCYTKNKHMHDNGQIRRRYIEQKPLWVDKQGNIREDLPQELIGLMLGEKLLIQCVDVFVPMVHINSGVNGLTGHCCCFTKDVTKNS